MTARKKRGATDPAEKALGDRIAQLMDEGYGQRQAVAIALEEARNGQLGPFAKGGRKRPNPPLLVLGNPPRGAVKMGRADYMEYKHVDDPGDVMRYHEFGRNVEMWALPDGSVLLRHRSARGRVWKDLPGEPGR